MDVTDNVRILPPGVHGCRTGKFSLFILILSTTEADKFTMDPVPLLHKITHLHLHMIHNSTQRSSYDNWQLIQIHFPLNSNAQASM